MSGDFAKFVIEVDSSSVPKAYDQLDKLDKKAQQTELQSEKLRRQWEKNAREIEKNTLQSQRNVQEQVKLEQQSRRLEQAARAQEIQQVRLNTARRAAELAVKKQEEAERKFTEVIKQNTSVLKGLESAVKSVEAAFKTLMAVLLVQQIINAAKAILGMADEYKALAAQVRLATETTGDYGAVLSALTDISIKNGVAMDDTVKLFRRVQMAAGDLGKSNKDIVQFTDAVQKIGIIGQTSPEGMRYALTQLGQSMSSGIVRAEEFNSLVENMPMLVNEAAKGLDTTAGKLRLLVIQGKLMSTDLFDGIMERMDEIEKQAAKMPMTMGRGWQMLQTSAMKFFGELDQEFRTTTYIGEFFRDIAKWLDTITPNAKKMAIEVKLGIAGYMETVYSYIVGVNELVRNTINSILDMFRKLAEMEDKVLERLPQNLPGVKGQRKNLKDVMNMPRVLKEDMPNYEAYTMLEKIHKYIDILNGKLKNTKEETGEISDKEQEIQQITQNAAQLEQQRLKYLQDIAEAQRKNTEELTKYNKELDRSLQNQRELLGILQKQGSQAYNKRKMELDAMERARGKVPESIVPTARVQINEQGKSILYYGDALKGPQSGYSTDGGNYSVSGNTGGGFVFPVAGRAPITGHVGDARYRNGHYHHAHQGVDLGGQRGAPVLAAMAGKVIESTFAEFAGNLVKILHQDGTMTRYLHLGKRNVQVGEQVAAGQMLGTVGSTGGNYAPHLHFEMLAANGAIMNPEGLLKGGKRATATKLSAAQRLKQRIASTNVATPAGANSQGYITAPDEANIKASGLKELAVDYEKAHINAELLVQSNNLQIKNVMELSDKLKESKAAMAQTKIEQDAWAEAIKTTGGFQDEYTVKVYDSIKSLKEMEAFFEGEQMIDGLQKSLDAQTKLTEATKQGPKALKEAELQLKINEALEGKILTAKQQQAITEKLIATEAQKVLQAKAQYVQQLDFDIEKQRKTLELTQQNPLQYDPVLGEFRNQQLQTEIDYLNRIMELKAQGIEMDETELASLHEKVSLQGQMSYQMAVIQQQQQRTVDFAQQMGSAFEGAFENAILGGQNLRQVLSGLLMQAAQLIYRLTIGRVINNAITKLAFGFAGGGGLGGGFSGTGALYNPIPSWTPSLNAQGNVYGGGHTMAFAQGGVVTSPTLFRFAQGGAMRNGLMGEAGPEAILPLRRLNNGNLGVQASGNGGGPTIVNNISVMVEAGAGKGGPEDEKLAKRIGKEMQAQVRALVTEEIREQTRPGNLLNQPVI